MTMAFTLRRDPSSCRRLGLAATTLCAALLVSAAGVSAPKAPAPATGDQAAKPDKKADQKVDKKGNKVFVCSLAECYQRAMQNSPQMAAAYTDLDKYEAKLREATSALYPRFDITGFFSILPRKKEGAIGENPFTDWDWTRIGPLMTGQVSVVQVLWTFGKIDTLRRMARTGLSVGKTIRAVARLELNYQISRAWWTLVLADELDEIIEKADKHLAKERERIETLRDDGDDYNPTDLLRLRMLQADFESRAREAGGGRVRAIDGLRLAMGLPDGSTVKARHDGLVRVVWQERAIGVWERLAAANHPRLLARRGGTLVRLQQVQLAKDRRWPDLLLTGRVAYTYAPTRELDAGDSLATNPTNPTQSGGGVALRWPLHIARTSAKIDHAEVALRRARADQRADEHKIRLEVRRLYRELSDATAMVAIHERAMKAARGWLRAESEMHEGGFQEYDEVLRSIEQYYRRRLTWLNSIYNHNVKLAETSRAVGMDMSQADKKKKPAAGGAE